MMTRRPRFFFFLALACRPCPGDCCRDRTRIGAHLLLMSAQPKDGRGGAKKEKSPTKKGLEMRGITSNVLHIHNGACAIPSPQPACLDSFVQSSYLRLEWWT
ncbi:hypothetical protein B0T24DRAFT_189016 [Lasiosphaeria ovina]|uniref:Secreted protein n=1 Tax=Lasiosphaeria ovina TaxID=92902 RepID=A0AAE0NF51_9PEZI|nr:hypothetical protein B0T24DRAFT_189016 [Lasiosphaeria ovina]